MALSGQELISDCGENLCGGAALWYERPMNSCCVCQKPKANLECASCHQSVCKSCAQFLYDDSFSFLPEGERKFAAGAYCSPCFDGEIAASLAEYEEILERARDVNVYMKNQSKETRLFKRTNEFLKVPSCEDREETLLRLAFLAARKGYNAIIDVDITSEKVIQSGGYQTSNWKGTAVAANLEFSKPPPPERGSPN